LGTDSSGSTCVAYAAVKAYYEARAREYDDWYLGVGRYADRDRPGWEEELARLIEVVATLPPARTLDVACGTGFLTRHLQGEITGLDQSTTMLEVAAGRLPRATLVQGDALDIPFPDGSFGRLFSGHFYGHLEEPERVRFLTEARRVARDLVVVDASQEHSPVEVEWQERILNEGSRWEVYKRYFTPEGLTAELGGGDVLHSGHWFVAVRA
jgi:ubiquinone/menaquinone biosynthesis C-methylase UbiE